MNPPPDLPLDTPRDPALAITGGQLPTPAQEDAARPAAEAGAGGGMKSVSALRASRMYLQRQLMGNPLRNVTPQTLSSWLDAWNYGYLRSAAQLFDVIERRDPVVGTVASKRYKAVSRLDWAVVKQEESPEADAHAKVLEDFWNRVEVTDAMARDIRGGVGQLLYQAATCIGHRWAVHEIVWDPRPGRLGATFIKVPIWFFENRSGKLRFLQGDYATAGIDLEPGGWLVHVGDGLHEATSVYTTMRGLSLGDWMAFSEKFGMPGLLWETPAQYESPEWESAVDAAARFGQEWAAVVAAGSKVTPIQAGGPGNQPQPPLVEYLERRIIMLWRGADLGTISSGQEGVGASLQGDETRILAEDDAARVVEPLHSQVERHVIAWHFGEGVEPKAHIQLEVPQSDTTDRDLKVDAFLVGMGVKLGIEDACERYGRRNAVEDESVLTPPTANPASQLPGVNLQLQSANEGKAAGRYMTRDELTAIARQGQLRDDIAMEMADAFRPIRERLQKVAQIEDPAQQRAAILAIREEVPAYVRQLGLRPAAADAIARLMGVAMVQGMVESAHGRHDTKPA